MSKQAVRLWESVLGQLAALSKISSTTLAAVSLQDDALLRIKALEGKISTCDTPQSEWKRIINEIKVGVSDSRVQQISRTAKYLEYARPMHVASGQYALCCAYCLWAGAWWRMLLQAQSP